MSQRDSGYERKANDLYETPGWVTCALFENLPRKVASAWEPACGNFAIATVLNRLGCLCAVSDLTNGVDFLSCDATRWNPFAAIITNPPYNLGQEFIERALSLTAAQGGLVAMLLRTDFDHAKTRAHLFGGCAQFARTVKLTRRITWFKPAKASPSFNHSWFVWDWQHKGPPITVYAGLTDTAKLLGYSG